MTVRGGAQLVGALPVSALAPGALPVALCFGPPGKKPVEEAAAALSLGPLG